MWIPVYFVMKKTHYISNTFKSYVCAQKLIKIIISYGTIRMSHFCIKFIAPKSKENKTIELKEYRFNEMNDYCLVLFYHTYAIVEYLQKFEHITMNIIYLFWTKFLLKLLKFSALFMQPVLWLDIMYWDLFIIYWLL